LKSIDSHIHVEVRKLYPEATLPKFNTHVDGSVMTMKYMSERKMADLAEGLIEKSMQYYKEENYSLTKELLTEEGDQVLFTITLE